MAILSDLGLSGLIQLNDSDPIRVLIDHFNNRQFIQIIRLIRFALFVNFILPKRSRSPALTASTDHR